jgi:hypothetical protein
MFVRYVEKKLAIGTAAAADVVNHLIRLSANNPIVVWDNRKSLWVGSKHSESNGNNPF